MSKASLKVAREIRRLVLKQGSSMTKAIRRQGVAEAIRGLTPDNISLII